MKRERNSLVAFLVGIIMLAAGLYWFMSSVSVTTGLYSFRVGSFNMSGLVVVPLIVGICWLFANPDSMGAKLVLVLGIVIILASIIVATEFRFRNRNLYEYVLMLVFIFGGAAMTLRILLAKPKDGMDDKRNHRENKEEIQRLEREIEELKRKL